MFDSSILFLKETEHIISVYCLTSVTETIFSATKRRSLRGSLSTVNE